MKLYIFIKVSIKICFVITKLASGMNTDNKNEGLLQDSYDERLLAGPLLHETLLYGHCQSSGEHSGR